MIYLSHDEFYKISENTECIEELILYVDNNNKHIFKEITSMFDITKDCFVLYFNLKNKKVQWDDMIKVKDIQSLIYIKG